MKRTTIVLTNFSSKALARIGKDMKMKQAEMIRRCIDVGLESIEIYFFKRRKL